MGKKNKSIALEKLETAQLDHCIALQILDERTRRLEDEVITHSNTESKADILTTVINLIKRNLKPDGQVLNIYEWGSRWFGTAHKSSADYDFLAIVTGYDQPPHINVVEEGNIDVALHEVTHFQKLLDQHVPWTIPFLSYDESGIWLYNHKFSFDLRLPQLKKALFININVNMNQAKSFWRNGEIRKSKKRVYYVLQILTFMNQVARKGIVYDKTEANKYLSVMLSTKYSSWKEFESWFVPIHNHLEGEFKRVVQEYREIESQLSPNSTLHIVNYLSLKSIDRLHTELSIDIVKLPEYEDLYHFHYNSLLSAPPESKIVSECNGLILNKNNLNIVCLPISRIYRHKDKSAPIFDMSSKRVFICPSDDYLIFMYFYNNKWNISSVSHPEAGESIENNQVKDIFWSIWEKLGFQLPNTNCSMYTYTFTVHSNLLKPIIYCDQEDIYLLSVRCAGSMGMPYHERDPSEVAKENGWLSLKECYNVDSQLFINQDPRLFALNDYLRSFGNIAALLLVDKNYTRLYVESPLKESLNEVNNTEDKQTHELMLLQSIAEYPFDNSTLNNYPFLNTQTTYTHVLSEFKQLINFLDEKYYPIKHLDRNEFNVEAEKIGDLSAFLYFMKRASFPSSKQYFEHDSDRKKVYKYIRVWWSLHKITTEQRKFDYCYK